MINEFIKNIKSLRLEVRLLGLGMIMMWEKMMQTQRLFIRTEIERFI